LILWEEQVSAAGGIGGRAVKLRLLDDASEAIGTGKLYARLIRDEHADALLGPYGSAASMMAAAEAERARRVIVNGAAPSRSLHKRAPRYVFQAGVPYSAYGAAVLDIVKAAGYRKVFVAARDDLAAREMAEATVEAARKLDLEAGNVEVFAAGTTDFGPQVAKARAAQSDAWIAFAEARDAAEMVKNFRGLNYAPRLFFARGAADPKFIAQVGQDAEYTLAALEYDVRLQTPGNDAFVKAFAARWGARPRASAAEAYAAATVLGEALRRGGGDAQKLREFLAAAEVPTVLGPYKVDPATGEQTAMRPAIVQIVRGRPQFVWPTVRTERRAAPYPQWSERRPIKP
ncbi:MAG TPA: ABC transporter substrate-binding protein, partial [Burkholderiales bacterium]|nr:ABC transporter substrate-binding protein [Burkholderiales bacterium]